ncbi:MULTISPECIES: 1-phosphofructokinase family hexose kinase [Microbacterium]|uniref:1-phosphofructokinase family hexose kinase n=1 Tax=Microbacterium aurugineum TaxID=2851642 RepID=A0ABY4J2E2_9MICO|nr:MULTISPECIES: 1-phosphofructokinase family hexose kinase [Microbacterium]MCK8467596.1 1-phosphofructokinase family hexose kinase [Microbacterium aurugineum]MCK8475928.1 1-phosphofructokinase family hexose kinase [Microbacterium aurugineum]QEA28040.1 1-phosphofructokinase family hexose kinase [Microbacterium sp. CBA3102]TCJ22980.1 1-phosphofructokinase family hexose kinase [Microbacterium sp. PI-1]UPL19189.1 1-phosphofructokinase family hexose kinase [Microbacterium aurugineum]
MILTVTPNPALDLTWRVDRLIEGGTHRADAGAARAGGKGLNVARVAHAEGADVLAITTTGGRVGQEFAAELGASGVPHALVPVVAETRRSIAVVDESLGDTTIINERGSNPTDPEWAALLAEVVERLPGTRVLVVSGSVPPGAPDSLLPMLIAVGRDAGVPVIVDTSGPALLRAADAGATVLKPNAAELVEATGITDPVAGARSLIARGTELVLLSLGAEGMLAVTASALVHARLDEPLAGNPTGAGDAGVAACAVLYAEGVRDPEQILRRATAWSAAAVLTPLAGDISPRWTELEQQLFLSYPDPASFRKDPS